MFSKLNLFFKKCKIGK